MNMETIDVHVNVNVYIYTHTGISGIYTIADIMSLLWTFIVVD